MDMQGSKIAITLPTGQVVEYELMRIGTVREYRELVKANQEREAFEIGARAERDSALKSCEVLTRQRDEVKAELASHSDSADARLAEMAHECDSALASVKEITRQRDDERARLDAMLEWAKKAEEAQAEKSERTASLTQKIEADKAALEKLLAEILGAVDQLNED